MKLREFNEWSQGLDVRKPKNIDNPGALRTLENAYITTGGQVKIRPGIKFHIEAGEYAGGLFSHNGKLWTLAVDGGRASWSATEDTPEIYKITVARPSGTTGKPLHVDFHGGFGVGLYFTVRWESTTAGKFVGSQYYLANANSFPTTTIPIVAGAPKTSAAVTFQRRIYAISEDGKTVKYCSLGKPEEWTGGDSGFLPVGEVSIHSNTATALALINNRLVVFMEDCIQIWALDPDPNRVELEEQVGGIGTRWQGSPVTINKDVYFLSDLGVRSLSNQSSYQNIKGNDIGSAIDSLVLDKIHKEPVHVDSQFWPGAGQYWLVLKDNLSNAVSDIFVLTKSKADKLNAWSTYHTTVTDLRQLAHLNERLFCISKGGWIYEFDENSDTDGKSTIAFEVVVETPFYQFGAEGQYKMFQGIEAIFEGVASIDHCVNPNNNDERTHSFEIAGDTRTKPNIPLGILAPMLSTRLTANSKYEPYPNGLDKPGFKTLNSLVYKYNPTTAGL